jgi:hypothetical protein
MSASPKTLQIAQRSVICHLSFVIGRASGESVLMRWMNVVEFSFYLVETFALPFAILVYVFERRKERIADQEELYQRLSDEYTNFLKLVLDNADLQLLRKGASLPSLTEEQKERRLALFGILVSIFERAYILVYEDHMDKQTRRLWSSWEDYLREWCQRPDFRKALPDLLEGEDPDFRKHIERIARSTPAVQEKPKGVQGVQE